MTTLTEWIAEQRALADAATAPPWKPWKSGTPWIEGGENGYDDVLAPDYVACMSHCYGGSSRVEISDADHAFIIASRTTVPALLAAVEAVVARHHLTPGGVCAWCESLYPYPCPDVRDLTDALGVEP